MDVREEVTDETVMQQRRKEPRHKGVLYLGSERTSGRIFRKTMGLEIRQWYYWLQARNVIEKLCHQSRPLNQELGPNSAVQCQGPIGKDSHRCSRQDPSHEATKETDTS
jgi:hypothetical protein